MSIFLVSSLLPSSLIDKLVEKGEVEKPMCATSLLIVNIALEAIEALNADNYKAFDANPGDRGCQNLAFELRCLHLLGLPKQEERSALEIAASRIKSLIKERLSKEKERNKCSSQVFFKEQVSLLAMSKEMEYVLHCYLSTVLRTPYKTLETGVVLTRSEVYKLGKLSAKIEDKLREGFPSQILQENQQKLSHLSAEAMRASAEKISSLQVEEKELIRSLLSKENTRVVRSRTFGCCFYGIKTVLLRLREEQGVICLKSIVPKGCLPFRIYLKSEMSGSEFTVLSEEAFISLSPNTPILVFEVEMSVGKEEASHLLMKHGFTDAVLVQASEEPLYEPGTELDKIVVPKAAKEEILSYQKKREDIPKFFAVDHVYFNLLRGEG